MFSINNLDIRVDEILREIEIMQDSKIEIDGKEYEVTMARYDCYDADHCDMTYDYIVNANSKSELNVQLNSIEGIVFDGTEYEMYGRALKGYLSYDYADNEGVYLIIQCYDVDCTSNVVALINLEEVQ